MNRKGDFVMGKKRNIIVGQSGGPTAVINSSLAGAVSYTHLDVYKRQEYPCETGSGEWQSALWDGTE